MSRLRLPTCVSVRFKTLVLFATVCSGFANPALAAPITYTDQAAYNLAVGSQTVIDLGSLPNGTVLGTQFTALGATFSDGNDFIYSGYGSSTGPITIDFSSDMNYLGVVYPGAVKITLLQGGSTVFTSPNFGGTGGPFFAGVSGVTFDQALITDWLDDVVFIDTVAFGAATAPEPGAMLLLGMGVLGIGVRRWRLKRA